MSGSALNDRSIQVGDNTNRPLGLTQRSPRPLNGGDCSIEAKITAIIYIQIRNFDNRPLNTRWPLNAVSLNTSSTVFCFDLVLIKTFCSNDNTYHRLRLERGKVAMQPDNVLCLICRKKKTQSCLQLPVVQRSNRWDEEKHRCDKKQSETFSVRFFTVQFIE